MKTRIGVCLLLLAGIIATAFAGEPTGEMPQNTPIAQVSESVFMVPDITEGAVIIHDFTINNRGTADLLLTGVHTDCGCATVSFTRAIPPGGRGSVKLKVNTAGYGGRKIFKKAVVRTNDPRRPEFRVAIQGNVGRFATIVPKRIIMRGTAGTELKKTVDIIPETEPPFKITGIRAESGKHLRYTLSHGQKGDAPIYRLTVENTKPDTGRYKDTLLLATDSKETPQIKIKAWGYID